MACLQSIYSDLYKALGTDSRSIDQQEHFGTISPLYNGLYGNLSKSRCDTSYCNGLQKLPVLHSSMSFIPPLNYHCDRILLAVCEIGVSFTLTGQ